MFRYLIVNADDFGLTAGVNAGILLAHHSGIVTSTTVMVNMPDAANGIQKALEEAPGMGLGLHLNLTSGSSVSEPDDIPGLVNDRGQFWSRDNLFPRLGKLDPLQVEVELRAQLNRFVTLAGNVPDHLDSHHHVTFLHPDLAEITFALAEEYSIPVRRPYPKCQEIALLSLMDGGMTKDRPRAETLIANISAMFSSVKIKPPDNFISDFYGHQTGLGDLLNILIDLPEGVSELMCHPGEVDRELENISSYTVERQTELDALIHPSAKELLASEGIILTTFGQLSHVYSTD